MNNITALPRACALAVKTTIAFPLQNFWILQGQALLDYPILVVVMQQIHWQPQLQIPAQVHWTGQTGAII